MGLCLLFLCLVEKKNQLLGLGVLLLCLVDKEDLLLGLCLCFCSCWKSVCVCVWLTRKSKKMLENLGMCSYVDL